MCSKNESHKRFAHFSEPLMAAAARQRAVLEAWKPVIERVTRGESTLCWDEKEKEFVEVMSRGGTADAKINKE